jgi:septation ring formation regulator EzrA
MDEFIKLLREMDVGHLIAMAGMFWIFYRYMEKRFDQIDRRFDKVEADIRDLQKGFSCLSERVARIEGILENKDCCMIKDSRMKKAE